MFEFIKNIIGAKKQKTDSTSPLKSKPKRISDESERVNFPLVGLLEPVCPYCTVALKKKPSRKSKCPSCGKIICVRTRPADRNQVLLTEEQTQILSEQWDVLRTALREFDDFKQRISTERQKVKRELGKNLSYADIRWGLLNKDSLEHIKNRNWGLYRNTRYQMASALIKDGKFDDALDMFFEVCYLDINGPNNVGGLGGGAADFIRSFDPSLGMLAPAAVEAIKSLSKYLVLTTDQVKTDFLDRTMRVSTNLKLPITPQIAWNQIEEKTSKPQ